MRISSMCIELKLYLFSNAMGVLGLCCVHVRCVQTESVRLTEMTTHPI